MFLASSNLLCTKNITMVGQLKCTSCSGTFGPTSFEDKNVHVCRFCRLREQGKAEYDQLLRIIEQGKEERDQLIRTVQQEKAERNNLGEELKAAKGMIESLTKDLKTLQEFTTANVAVASSSSEATPADAPVPPSSPSGRSRDFQVVRNNVRPSVRKVMPINCQNRFKILSDTLDEEEEEVRLVGDSIIGGQLKEFCARAPNSRKRYCIPGGGVDDVIAAIDKVADLAPPNTTYVIHVGTNDVEQTRSEELIEKYKRLIRTFKDKSSDIVISGIIPRMMATRRFFNIATSINRRLANLCNKEHIGFVDTWDSFYHDRSLFKHDGIHLNQVGAARFGRLLNDAVKEHRSKNGGARVQEDT